jgi:uncharacterized membrane protein YgcG
MGALALVAAACSSGPATGSVGDTLPAMDGNVKLVSVISPAYVSSTSPAHPRPGHKLVLVVLTASNPNSSPVKFGDIYVSSRIVDSHNLTHLAASTARFAAFDCAQYPVFGTVAAGKSVTGCEVFEISYAVVPVKLKINGKFKAEWDIPATSVVPSRGIALIPKSYPPVAANAGTPTTTTPATPTTVLSATPTTVPSGGGSGGGGSSGGSGNSGAAGNTGSGGSGPKHPNRVYHLPRITRVSPNQAAPGQSVTIHGHRLNGVTSVSFGGVPGTITQNTKGTVVVMVPSTGVSGYVTVTTLYGSSRSPRTFTIL